MRKVLCFVTIICVFASSALVGQASRIQEIEREVQDIEVRMSDIQEQKDEQKEVADSLLQQANDLRDLVRQKESSLDDWVDEMDVILGQIEDLKEQIKNAEEDVRLREQEAAERVRVIYENSRKTIFDLFIESGSIAEFFQKIQMYRFIAQNDAEVIEQLEIARKDLDVKQAMLVGNYVQLVEHINETRLDINEIKVARISLLQEVSLAQEKLRHLSSQESQLEKESEFLAYQLKALQRNTVQYVGGDMTWPLPADHTVHSPFGMRLHPVYGHYRMHTGIDIGGRFGMEIVAANHGTVVYSQYNSGYGYYIVIDHGGGISTLYAHCSRLLVRAGQIVQKGQTIALVGSTGLSTGPHLHFEVRVNGNPVNPLNYYQRR